jgi:hypothetical protein
MGRVLYLLSGNIVAVSMITANDLLTQMRQASELYYRLVLVCQPRVFAPSVLYQAASQAGARVLNVNLELSKLLLEMTQRQRKLQLGSALEQAIAGFVARETTIGEFVFLDHIDILFEPSLESNPLALLQRASRSRVVAAVWYGALEDGVLTYAQPNHPAFRRYPTKDFLAIQLD